MTKDNMNSNSGNSFSSGSNMNSDSSYSSGSNMKSGSWGSNSTSSGASNSTGGDGCSHTPNSSIHCTVNSCANHCQSQNYCGLNAVQIGTHESNPTKTECVDCNSFKMK